ncbi:hypothetical protein HAX54_044931 [Datura stramonium]|uniref:Uncharacterized protein n=1 Tax=Datura stramonium TaxID=4076 RepID=A0ABS8WFD2_DATST|nr:hypothetical protein [Datura stramonium]
MEVRPWVLFPVEGGGVRRAWWWPAVCLVVVTTAVAGSEGGEICSGVGVQWMFSGGGKVRGDGGYGVFRFVGRGEREKKGARGSPEIMEREMERGRSTYRKLWRFAGEGEGCGSARWLEQRKRR